MRLKYIIFTILVVAFSSQLAFSQVKVTDKAGDKIILMPDGTWRYADEDKQATASNDVKAKQQAGKPNLDKKKLTAAEKKKLAEQEKAEKRRQKIAEKVAKQQKDKNKDTAKKDTSKKDKKDKNTAKKDDKKKNNKSKDTAKKDNSKKNNKSKSTAKKANSKKDNKSKSTAKKNNNKKNNKSKDTAKANTKKNNSNKTKATQKKANDKAVEPKKISNKQKLKLAKQQFKPFKKQDYIVIREQECSYSMNEIDPFTGKKKVALHSEFFFGYTHPQLEKYLKGDHYLVCDAYLSQVAGLKALNVKFTIDSPNAQEDYGAILEGSRMLISLLDGTTITLISAEGDDGKVDKTKKQTIYKAYFVIDAKQEKQILKSEINQVRMVWSEGYEDYDIHEVDFLINQLKCLEAAVK